MAAKAKGIRFGASGRQCRSSLLFMRIYLSMYIYMFLTERDSRQSHARKTELLLEKVILCKTIEREIKGLLGKEGMDEYVDMHYFRRAHRKVAALDIFVMKEPFPSEYDNR